MKNIYLSIKLLVLIIFLLSALFTLAACDGDSDAAAGANPAPTPEPTPTPAPSNEPLRVISTPNPSVFPLLIALANDPTLPVTLLPVANGSEINDAFTNQNGEALLSMTWVAASRAASGVAPDLVLVSANYWRGFFELVPEDQQPVTSFADLIGKNLLLSGPVGGGRNGGPDLLFQAALKRQGFDPKDFTESQVIIPINGQDKEFTRRQYVSGDFRVYYLPVNDAAPVLISRQLLEDGDGDPTNNLPASASFMVEPAATGIVMNGMAANVTISKSLDMQDIFSGYSSWPEDLLPLGGMSIRNQVLSDNLRTDTVNKVRSAYQAAARQLATANQQEITALAATIVAGLNQYYSAYNLQLPEAVIRAALTNGDLVYRADVNMLSIQADLINFHQEILSTVPAALFYSAQ